MVNFKKRKEKYILQNWTKERIMDQIFKFYFKLEKVYFVKLKFAEFRILEA